MPPEYTGFDIRARIVYNPAVDRKHLNKPRIHIIIHEGMLQNREYTFFLEPSAEADQDFTMMMQDLIKHGLTKQF